MIVPRIQNAHCQVYVRDSAKRNPMSCVQQRPLRNVASPRPMTTATLPTDVAISTAIGVRVAVLIATLPTDVAISTATRAPIAPLAVIACPMQKYRILTRQILGDATEKRN